MKAGLLEGVMGEFFSRDPYSKEAVRPGLKAESGNPLKLSDLKEEHHRLQSIRDNLIRLFNTRRGSIRHLPSYGLPDLSSVASDTSELIAALWENVRLYEPRLRLLDVKKREESDDKASVFELTFDLVAELVEGRVPTNFSAEFSASAPVEVKPILEDK